MNFRCGPTLKAVAVIAIAAAYSGPRPAPAQTPAGQSSEPPSEATARLPIILKWTPMVGNGNAVPTEQAANEKLTRYIHLERLADDIRSFVIRWQVVPEGEYPAKPNLFRDDIYPSGILHMGKGQRAADIAIQTYETGRPDWRREFKVVLSDAENGNPVLSPYMIPIEPSFVVFGDLTCAPGRKDLCDVGDETGVEKPH